MRISDWSSDVCSSDLWRDGPTHLRAWRREWLLQARWRLYAASVHHSDAVRIVHNRGRIRCSLRMLHRDRFRGRILDRRAQRPSHRGCAYRDLRSEEHTSELQSLMRISYAVFCLKKKKKHKEY